MRHIIKKIAALSIGATMIGATLMGAMASDLSHYSQPVLDNGLDISAEDIIGSLDVSTALAATIHEEHGDIDFGKYDLSFEKNIEFEGSSPKCLYMYGEGAIECGSGKVAGGIYDCCPKNKPVCCDAKGKGKPVCCKNETGGSINPFIGNEICTKNTKGNYCKVKTCPDSTPKMCPEKNAEKEDYPTCCPSDANCIQVWTGTFGPNVWECGKAECNDDEDKCYEKNGNAFCCPKGQCLHVAGYYWMCGSENCDKDKYIQCDGLDEYTSIKKCCKIGVETCKRHPNGYPFCMSNPPEILDSRGSTSGTSIYLLRDSSSYQLNGIAYFLSPTIYFNKYAHVSFNYSLYYFADFSSVKSYKYSQEKDIFDFCTEETVIDNQTFTISPSGSNISFNNEFFFDIPSGAVDNDTNLTIVKYSLSCPILDKEDSFVGAEGDMCLLENESGIYSTDGSNPTCCSGLIAVPNSTVSGDTCSPSQQDDFICTNCGDGICGAGENKCNCAADCSRSITEKISDWFSGNFSLRQILRIIFFWKKG